MVPSTIFHVLTVPTAGTAMVNAITIAMPVLTEYSVASPSTSMGLYSQNKWAQELTDTCGSRGIEFVLHLGDFVDEVVFNSLSINAIQLSVT